MINDEYKEILYNEFIKCLTEKSYKSLFCISEIHLSQYEKIINLAIEIFKEHSMYFDFGYIYRDFEDKTTYITFQNGSCVMVSILNKSCRGFRVNKLIIDKSISNEVVEQVLIPYLRPTQEDIIKKDIIFVDINKIQNKKYYLIAKDGIYYQAYMKYQKYLKRLDELTEQFYKENEIKGVPPKTFANHFEGEIRRGNTEIANCYVSIKDDLSPLNRKWLEFKNKNGLIIYPFDTSLSQCFNLNEGYTYNVYYVGDNIYYSIEADVDICFNEYYKNYLIEITEEEFYKGVENYENSK